MKRRWMCRCTMGEGRTIRPTYGSTAHREAARCSSSGWGGGATDPRNSWDQFEGILQTDGYVAYDRVGGPKMVHAACWAHARRKFFEAAKLNPSDVAATRIVARIDDLFGIDAQARELNLDHAARHALRLERAKPLVEVIRVRWRRSATFVCLPARWGRRRTTRSRAGGSSRAFWSIPNWN